MQNVEYAVDVYSHCPLSFRWVARHAPPDRARPVPVPSPALRPHRALYSSLHILRAHRRRIKPTPRLRRRRDLAGCRRQCAPKVRKARLQRRRPRVGDHVVVAQVVADTCVGGCVGWRHCSSSSSSRGPIASRSSRRAIHKLARYANSSSTRGIRTRTDAC